MLIWTLGFGYPGLHSLLAHADSAILLHPDSAQLYLERGEWYRLHGDSALAEKDYNTAYFLKHDWHSVHYCRATLLNDRGNYPAALEQVDRFLESSPDDINGHVLRGSILLQLSEREQAVAAFQTAIELHQTPPPHLFSLVAGIFLATQDTNSALAWLHRGRREAGKVELLEKMKIEIYVARGQMNQALSTLDTLFQNRGNKVRFYYQQGVIYKTFSHMRASKTSFENALSSYASIPKRVAHSPDYRALQDSIKQHLADFQ